MTSHASGRYDVAEVVHAPALPLPDDKRVPATWGAIPVAPPGSAEPTLLRWAAVEASGAARFRIAVAIDVREEKLIEVFLPASGRRLGVFDIRYPSVFIPYELVLSPQNAEAAAREGLGLRMTQGEDALWILYSTRETEDGAAPLLPHLYWPETGASNRLAQFVARMASTASLQQFGWMEGCVLDGLYDLEQMYGRAAIRPAIERHLRSFLDAEGNLRYEDPYSRPADGRIYSVEMATLPFATIARIWPDHPALDVAIAWWQDTVDKTGGVRSHANLTAEGSYIVAYPLAVTAAARGREDLARLAVEHLLARRERLFDGEALYQQRRLDGRYAFRNWARGCAWYILGLTRSLIELGDVPERAQLIDALREVAGWLLRFQRADGLWSCYIDEPETGAETSGSAGIAAALAKGALHGLLPHSALDAARRTLRALEKYLTPDGFLTGVCQMNKGGETLQRSGYRVISQMGMGLMAQLYATLNGPTAQGAPS